MVGRNSKPPITNSVVSIHYPVIVTIKVVAGPLLTNTKQDHIDTDNKGAHRQGEELADTAQHHDHTHGDVDKPAKSRKILARC